MDQWLKLLRGGRRCFSAGVSRSLRCVEEGREAEEDALANGVIVRHRKKKKTSATVWESLLHSNRKISLSHTNTRTVRQGFFLFYQNLYFHINISFTVPLCHIFFFQFILQ